MGSLVGKLLVQYCDMELGQVRGGGSFFWCNTTSLDSSNIVFCCSSHFRIRITCSPKRHYVSDLIVEYSYDILILSIYTLFTSEPRSSSRSPNAEAIDRSTPILPNTLANIVSCPITIFKRCVVEFSPTNMIRRRTKTLIV